MQINLVDVKGKTTGARNDEYTPTVKQPTRQNRKSGQPSQLVDPGKAYFSAQGVSGVSTSKHRDTSKGSNTSLNRSMRDQIMKVYNSKVSIKKNL